MSRPMPMNCKCAVCNAESEQMILLSTNTFGAPDLDLRPPQMKRSTMCWWIQECPECGYVSENIEKGIKIDAEFLKKEEYISCDGRNFRGELAKRFYKRYMIAMREKNCESAFSSLLCAAWDCDDTRDEENAVYCRKLAIPLLEEIIEKDDSKETRQLQKADLLRRAGLFEQLISEFSGVRFKGQNHDKIIAFQIKRAKQQDTKRYTVADVMLGL